MYRLDEPQQHIVRNAAAVADQSVAPHAARVDRDRTFPRESIAALGNAGLLGLTIPASLRQTCSGLGTRCGMPRNTDPSPMVSQST